MGRFLMRNPKQGFRMRRMVLDKVTFLLFSLCALLLISSVMERSSQPEEKSLISLLELRRATLLKHCSTKAKKHSSPKPSLKNLHFIRNLPGDLVFCLLKKGGSPSLTDFFTNNLEPADEVEWLNGPDEMEQE